jgi:sucrose phosphorylase
MQDNNCTLEHRIRTHIEYIYQDVDTVQDYADLTCKILASAQIEILSDDQDIPIELWSQEDVAIISYGDTIVHKDLVPLVSLKNFLDKHMQGVINTVHLLPFFPFSSDDGFAVQDYCCVNPILGDWEHINNIANDYKLMADLVVNHCSSQSHWFKNFIAGKGEGKDFFFTAFPEDDISNVVRPRTSSLLNPVETANGIQYVWCTFSNDQVDLNFKNPDVLVEFIQIIRFYLDNGVKVFRLDAIAFLWKIEGTSCLNLDQTHEIVRLFRTIIERIQPEAIIITETNIPNQENLSYFGNANEAHCVYNFSLPPLLLNTFLTGSCRYLKQWMMSMPPAQLGTAYFNFIASHDGIGLRPAKGLLSHDEINTLTETMQSFGGEISWRTGKDGTERPYEVNITLFDALQGTVNGKDQYGEVRFLCAHTIMLALEGIPAFYIHSLLATENDHERYAKTGRKRSINRTQWDINDIDQRLSDQSTHHARINKKLKQIIQVRKKQKAFHPNATQFTLHLGDHIFGFWRQSMDRSQSVFSISNITHQPQQLSLLDINLISTEIWIDLLTGEKIHGIDGKIHLEPYQSVWISNQNV